MTTKERYAGVIKWFQENKPIAETELQYHDPFQLLIAVIPVGTMYRQTGKHDNPGSIRSIPYSTRSGRSYTGRSLYIH